MDRRGDLFQRFLEQAGFTCHTLAAFEPYLGRFQSPGWERQQRQIGKWIASLPKPVGVLACNDDRGLELLDACRDVAATVPDNVAVIGVDNDECVGTLSIPPLTSIDSNAQRVGYEAAGLLDSLIDGRKPPSRPRYVHPLGIVTRQSTDVMAIDDREIVAALRFIRQNACRQIRIADVIKQAGSSRASLESGLKKNLGRTIHQEIQRVRLERAVDLLTATNLPIKRIAFETGFQTVQYLTRVFRKTMGAPPARFRRRCQLELRSARSPS